MPDTQTIPIDLEARREHERHKYVSLLDTSYGSTNHGRFAYRIVQRFKPRFVIDFGCGRNDFIRHLRNLGIDGLGIDFAFPEADVIAPMHRVPISADLAHVVTCFDALEHLLPEEIDEVLAEMQRIAVPGGRFVFSICTRESNWKVQGQTLHPTVRSISWWLERIARVAPWTAAPAEKITSWGRSTMHENGGDIAALQAGLKRRKPARWGLRLYTADFDSVSLCDFYRGRSAFLVLSGPSLNQLDLSQLNRRGIVTMAVNNAWAVHRPTLWTCVDDPGRFIDTGWKDPGILKFVPMTHVDHRLRIQLAGGKMSASAFRVRHMPSVLLYRRNDHFDHQRFLKSDTVNWGHDGGTTDSLGIKGKRSVMLAALHLLHYLGFRTVYLIGADFKMSAERGYAFTENRSAAAVKHNNILYDSLKQRFAALQPHFKQHGLTVLNATPDSGLDAFEKISFDDAVKRAGAECAKPVNTEGWYEVAKKSKA